jgi:ribosome-associated protein
MNRRAAPHRGIDTHYGEAAADERPSKTQLKQQSHELQTLGEQLAALSDERLAHAPMPDALREAIQTYRRTKSHEGRRRQMQYVGKLMRTADAEVLREAVAAAALGSARDTLLLHEAERWRDALIADDDALTRWAAEHPAGDMQPLRALVRQARREAPPDASAVSQGLAPRRGRAYRDLFRTLRDTLAERGDE